MTEGTEQINSAGEIQGISSEQQIAQRKNITTKPEQ